MDSQVAIVSGALFERALRGNPGVSLASGIAAVGVSFFSLTVVLLVVYTATNAGFLEFGCALVVSFLLFWGIEAIRAWRAANGRAPHRGEG